MSEVPLYRNKGLTFPALGCSVSKPTMPAANERGGDHRNYFKDFHPENGSGQGLNLALTGLFVPKSRDSGQHERCQRDRGTSLIRNNPPV